MSSIVLKNAEEIELMRESALIVSKTLGMLAGEIKPGITLLVDTQRKFHYGAWSSPWIFRFV